MKSIQELREYDASVNCFEKNSCGGGSKYDQHQIFFWESVQWYQGKKTIENDIKESLLENILPSVARYVLKGHPINQKNTFSFLKSSDGTSVLI